MDYTFENLRASFYNVAANWPLLLIRMAEGFVAVMIIVVFLVIGAIPIFFTDFERLSRLGSLEDFEKILDVLSVRNVITLSALPIMLLVGLLLVMLIHSFVQAGTVAGYLDGIRASEVSSAKELVRFRAFNMTRFLTAARAFGWPVFWIYNVVWGIVLPVALIPLVLLAGSIFVLRESPAVIAVGVAGAAVVALFFVIASIVAVAWSDLAIVFCIDRQRRWPAALRSSLVFLKQHLAPVFVTLVVLFSLSLFGSLFLGGFYAAIGAGSLAPFMALVTFPLGILGGLVQTLFSLFVANWKIAAMTGLPGQLLRDDKLDAAGVVSSPKVPYSVLCLLS